MRIGIIAPPWVPVPPDKYGGTEEFIDELACGLRRAGHDVLLFCTGDSSCAVTRRWRYDTARPDVIGDAEVETTHVEDAYAAMGDVDVVHDNTIAGPLHALSVSDRPVVVTHHGPFDGDACRYFGAIDERVALVAISQHQASTARDVRVAAVIHHGIDPTRFPVGDGEGGYFVFIGRMAPGKGAHRAAALARACGIKLIIVGKSREPAERAYFRDHVDPLLGGDVEYRGEVDNAEKLALLGGATALINPLEWPEPFGLVMIEAMACGTPVITTACGAAPEIVEDGRTGYVCRDVEQMASRIAEADALDRGACRRLVEHRFATERMVRDYEALFRSLVVNAAVA
jgi:glycosyltransferase involved in cell wall biosynthesis